jgi:hypothetical protein
VLQSWFEPFRFLAEPVEITAQFIVKNHRPVMPEAHDIRVVMPVILKSAVAAEANKNRL